jgi:hypothetical protein
LVRPEAQFAKSDSLQSRPCDRQLIAFFVMFGAAQKLSGRSVIASSAARSSSVTFCLSDSMNAACTVFPQRLIGLRHSTSYIEASASRSGTFPRILFIRIGVRHVIFARKRPELLRVARNERGQVRILAGVREGGQHRDLRYIAQPDNCVPNLLSIESARYRPIPPPGQLADIGSQGE